MSLGAADRGAVNSGSPLGCDCVMGKRKPVVTSVDGRQSWIVWS